MFIVKAFPTVLFKLYLFNDRFFPLCCFTCIRAEHDKFQITSTCYRKSLLSDLIACLYLKTSKQIII